jgi:hypothetical protein
VDVAAEPPGHWSAAWTTWGRDTLAWPRADPYSTARGSPGTVPSVVARRPRGASDSGCVRVLRSMAEPAPVLSDMTMRHDNDDLSALYREHYSGMVRLAALITGSQAVAHDLVQDSFVAIAERWATVDRPVAYLRAGCFPRSSTRCGPRSGG